MKNKIFIILIIATVFFATACYQFTGGYRGLKFKKVETQNVYYDLKQNTVYLIDTPQKNLWIHITKETGSAHENSVIFNKIIKEELSIKSEYTFPDSLFLPYKTKRITIELNVDDKMGKMYSIIIEPEYWSIKNKIYGFVRVYENP